jgi:DNA repair exonuclease SbcCD ATPase subunit
MKLIRTQLENVCQFAALKHTWDPGLNGILGPNGAGKSNLLKAIKYGITGQYDNEGTKAENVFQLASDKSRSRVIQELEHDGTHLEIVRVLRRGTSHCRINNGEQIDGDMEVTRTVLDVLGVDQKILSQYVFVAQKEIASFINETPGERARNFQQLFGIGGAATAYKILGDEIKRVNPQLRSPEIDVTRTRIEANQAIKFDIEQALAFDRSALAAIPEAADRELVAAAAQYDRDHTELARLWDRQPRAEADVRVALQDKQTAAAELQELQRARDEGKEDVGIARDALNRWQAYQARLARKSRLAKRREGMTLESRAHPRPDPPPVEPDDNEIDRRREEAVIQVASMRNFLVKFGSRPGICPTCGSETDVLQKRADEYERELPVWEARLAETQQLQADRANYARRFAAWEQWRQGYNRRLEELTQDEAADEAEGETPDLEQGAATAVIDAYQALEDAIEVAADAAGRAAVAHTQAQTRLDGLLEQIHSRTKTLGRHVDTDDVAAACSRLESAGSLRTTIANREGELRALDRALAVDAALLGRLEAVEHKAAVDRLWVYHLSQVQGKLHPRQIPQLVAESYLEVLADDINDILEESDAEFRVRLGTDLSFMADFSAGRYAGTTTPAPRLSEGQKVILALPFRVAVNSLFAGTAGLLCLDEPTESLDAQNLACLEIAVARLRALSESRGLQVLLVTHEPSLDRLFDGVLRL